MSILITTSIFWAPPLIGTIATIAESIYRKKNPVSLDDGDERRESYLQWKATQQAQEVSRVAEHKAQLKNKARIKAQTLLNSTFNTFIGRRVAALKKSITKSTGSKSLPESVYVLSNISMPNMVKIGFTTRPIQERVKELNRSTSVPTPFKVVHHWEVEKGKVAEQELHNLADHHRVNTRKEFFNDSCLTSVLQYMSNRPKTIKQAVK